MIGDIIQEQRLLKNMSRDTLSKGICTEKYIYLIERNQRNPSAYILNQLSEKLNIDLFEYYQYLNFKNSTLVLGYKKNFERYMQLGDIEKLKNESTKASQLEDFKHEPLSYDIIVNTSLYETLSEHKTNETIEKLTNIFNTQNLNIDTLTMINGYIVLSTCYQLEGQLDKAKEVLEVAYALIKNKTDFSRYHTVIVNVMISLTSLLYHAKEYEELIKHSKFLLDFQEEYNQYNRIYYADFYLSFGYYWTKQFSNSKEHFLRGIHSASLSKNKMDLTFIINMSDFNEIINTLNINQHYVQPLYDHLDLNNS